MNSESDNKSKEKILEVYERTIEDGIKYDGILTDINFYNLVCKAAANNSLFTVESNNLSMFKYTFNNDDSILIVFSIPITKEKGNKHLSERVMDIIKLLEECFTCLDYVNSKEVKEDRFVYVTVVKKIKTEV